ncbi:MAG TPA: hypothetical protein VMB02_02660 [Candidatus Aquilonibacter sp.]|nr:hypothetical protein [Candidatus Aquilonibacter sp.]
MKLSQIGMERLFRISSGLTIVGLVIEIVSLLWFHPLAFALFAFLGMAFIGLGIVTYLVSLVFAVAPPAGSNS